MSQEYIKCWLANKHTKLCGLLVMLLQLNQPANHRTSLLLVVAKHAVTALSWLLRWDELSSECSVLKTGNFEQNKDYFMSNTLVTLTQDYLHFTVCFYQSAQISPTYFKNHQKYQNKLSLVWYGMVWYGIFISCLGSPRHSVGH